MASDSVDNQNKNNDGPGPGIKRVVTDQGNKAQRLLRVDQIYSRKDRQVHFVKTAKLTPQPDRFGKTALVVRRIISAKGMVTDCEIDIKSSHLDRLFKEIFKGVPDLQLNESPPIASPSLLFHAAPKLVEIKEEEKQKPQPDQLLINDIGTALRFVEEDFGGEINNLQSLLSKGEITFDLLWAIFPPRELIVAMEHGILRQPQALSIATSEYGTRDNGSKYYEAEGRVITHDGEDFGKGRFAPVIEAFEGAKKLTILEFYPIKYHPDEPALRKRLIARGKKYVALLENPTCQDYPLNHAVGENEHNLQRADKDSEKINVKGRVMVDPVAFCIHNSSSTLNRPGVPPSHWMTMEGLTDDDYLNCAYWINGFSLTHKRWCRMVVEAMEDIQWNHQAFQKLVIDEDRRQLIHALVKAHRNDATTFDDIIQNKGQGLVGLLSGSPGVGKTLTAEAVAEVTERPLYMVSAGELGIQADTVDKRLGVILDVTRRWGCVLLIDEADVFLGTRGHDLQRDSLVSVFLRRLEYFMGVCILTTNRKQDIDPAFQSRIHFTLHYPELDEASRKAVWANFLNMVGRSSEISKIGQGEIDQLAKHVLNGRQIKNIVACTVSLSRESGETITSERIEMMIKMLTN
ncbi:AAA family ATPase [Cucurbitaria berberidis CBS 394.84]|uniref:AAA family ATPase n=1 Tax=Cucurbitaria berberidis CBS 394.84 TaxID=1168544 RepID=A0A9P4L7K6_9PLEO|nr:AAA family ATPase [Cucurbitaria berberidis CBS 394.84]KAF1845136.1 AAA family ATPase [Cucurbitaria berberidis CBS 394.84]